MNKNLNVYIFVGINNWKKGKIIFYLSIHRFIDINKIIMFIIYMLKSIITTKGIYANKLKDYLTHTCIHI